MSWLSLETRLSNLKSVGLTILELLAFNAQTFRGHVTLAMPPFQNFLKVSCTNCPRKHACQVWSPYSFNRFGAIAFNAQNFRGHVTLATPLFGKILRGHVRTSLGTCLSNLKSVILTVLGLFAFNSHFKLVRLTGPLRTHRQKHRHTSNEHIISAIHFVHLAEIIIIHFCNIFVRRLC